jgi:hypothetical protein
MRSVPEALERAARYCLWAGLCYLRGRKIVHDSAWRIRSSRLSLDHPGLRHICGGSDPRDLIRQRVRDGLATGALPPANGTRSWAGRGTGRTCRVCNEPIAPDQIEHEIEAPDSVLVHQACLIIWRDESRVTR